MSFYDDGRWTNAYTDEEIDAIVSKLSDPLFKKDLWVVEPDTDEVIEIYVNFDSSLPGIEWNYYKFDFVLKAYELANGDVQKFFEIWRYLNNWFSCLALQAGGTGSSPVAATNLIFDILEQQI